MNNRRTFSHTAGMKKLLLILLTAVIAAAGLGTAACSKGQTGGGNNALSGYTRSAGEENGDDGCKTATAATTALAGATASTGIYRKTICPLCPATRTLRAE